MSRGGQHRQVLLSLVLVLLAVPTCFAQGGTPKPVYNTFVNWQKNQITIDASVDVSGLGVMVPDARAKAEELIRKDRSTMIDRALFPIQADSFHTVGDLAASSSKVLTALQSLIQPQTEQYAKMSKDLNRVTVQYQLPIFPNLGSIFVNQVKANPPSPLLSYVPTTKFSGIVIYAKGSLPVHGENRSSEFVPSLFPKILDENMDVLASPDTVAPEALKSHGVAAFSNSTNEKPFTARVGLVPFRTVAVELFGKSATDIVISNQAADRLLASPENIKLLTEGRILIIADLPQSGVTSGS